MRFRPLLLLALFFGALSASLAQLGLILGMGAVRSFPDALVFGLYLTVGAVLGYLLVNTLAGLLAALLRRGSAAGRLAFGLDAFLLLAAVSTALFVVATRPFWLGNPGDAVGIAVCVFLSLAVAWLLARRERLASLPVVAVLAALFFLLPPLAAVALRTESAPPSAVAEKALSTSKVFLIGFDGANWDVMEPLLRQGKLPNFERLMKEGSWGNLRSEAAVNQPFSNSASTGMRTPVVWETIVTGHSPVEHGVWDFFFSHVPGMEGNLPFRLPLRLPVVRSLLAPWVEEFPVLSTSGRRSRLWEIYDQSGRPSRVIGFVDTWPAFDMKSGELVSDRAHLADDPASSWPEPWGDAVAPPLYFHYPELAVQKLGVEFDPRYVNRYSPGNYRFQLFEKIRRRLDLLAFREATMAVVGAPFDPDYERKFKPGDPAYRMSLRLKQLADDLVRDHYYADVAERAVSEAAGRGEKEPVLSAFYFRSTDTVQHLFWKYYEPKAFSKPDPEEVRRFGPVIPRVYEDADRLLGRMLALAGPDTTILVVSDHGGGAWTELEGIFGGAEERGGTYENYSGNHRINGILLAKGPGIHRGRRLPDASIYDVAPLA
ncbi:MAG TPA: alkaline phosphatase family protein, partial [Thermoanaerobaculia bacterium]|nr:alkaline phosphatase family protein [Thermoanaerobaculia bacterium]